ncbi:MAG: DNA-binding protein [Bacteroidetes bacterium MedPE-SWsnd-G1]|uniref:Cold shock domain-containing protein n=1 Tax=Urechidicola vernalis TaxID=3075600 RepID=A0ABU2Y167_9FLAO|nr:cold shock domain-containing protein [Urechidicola sp. P050]MDT0551932.1 cold shock domain-containing protein [Urechidicola sp. P050]OIQ37127.1 MAG: DNA-binding protein [Bacteroidetes bacterium MedPE-SWsnd-G1]
MAKSQQTFNKSEKEKKRLKKRELKAKKKEERKANAVKGAKLEDMLVYVDENGQLTDTPPDPTKKIKVDAESIVLGIPKKEEMEEESKEKQGKVSFFDTSKGFGFIIDSTTQEKYFVHVSGLIDQIGENDKVSFELEKGLKGMNAVRVKKI